MSFDLDSLEPGVDIDAIDIDKMDKGHTLEALEEALSDDPPPVDDPAPVDNPAPVDEPPADDPAPSDEEPEEQPRNEKGQFEKKEARIPKSRFDEQVGKERAAREAAEARAAALEKQIVEQQAAQKQNADVEAMEAKIEDMEKQYTALLLDGEADKAAALRKQIRSAERQIATIDVENRTVQRTTQIIESQQTNLVVAKLESEHPELNPDSDQFDEELADDILSKQRSYMQKFGLSPSAALTKAAEYVMGRVAKAAEADPDPKGLAKAAEERKTAQVKKNLAAAKAQPASMRDVGLDSDKAGQSSSLPDVTRMTQDEFNALPETTRARLRGDVL